MISVDEALARILAKMTPTATEVVSLNQAHGRVLAEDLAARRTQPPHDVSAMDGYAVRALDLVSPPTVLAVVGEVPAGGHFDGHLESDQAVRIFTGAPVPAQADTVVIQENVEKLEDGRIRLSAAYPEGDNIRLRGSDFKENATLLAAGTRLTPRHVTLAAGMNAPWLSVHRRPKVGLLATGNELARPGESAHRDDIIASTLYGLYGYLQSWGAEPVDLGIARDNLDDLQAAFAKARGLDLLITLGGASVGDYDLVQQALTLKGLQLDFWKIAMKPGKPLLFGALDAMPVIGLPGNPVSALVGALLFVHAAVDRLQGVPSNGPKLTSAHAGQDLKANPGNRRAYVRAALQQSPDGVAQVVPLEIQDSAVMSAFAQADALIVRPEGDGPVAAGSPVAVLAMTDL